MKKQLLTLIAFAAGITAAYAQCGTTASRIWDGGGADNNFFTAANWSGDVVPDCNDNISFGNQTSKDCEIPDSFITTGNVLINSTYKGRIVVSGTGTVFQAANFSMDGTIVTFNPEIGHCSFSNITVGGNGMLNYASREGITVTGTLTLNAGGFIAFRTGTTVNLNAIVLNAYGQIKSPEKGIVNLTGNIQKAKVSTFDHRFSTWNIIGSASQSVGASIGGSGANAADGTISFWNVNLNKTNTSSTSSDNWTMADNTDTIIVENRLTVLAGDIAGSTGNSGFLFHDTLELVGQGAQGHTGRIFCGGNKTADVILNGNTNYNGASGNLIVLKESNGSILNFHKGSGTEVSLFTNITNVVSGTIAFPDDVTVNIPNNSTFTIDANATLTMPATATVKTDAGTLNITGSVIANQGTLEFVGSNVTALNFGGSARKAFYNITVNTANTSAPVRIAQTDTLEALNDVTIKTGLLSRAAPTSIGVVYINGNFEVQSSASASTYSDGLEFVIGGNSNTQYIGDALLPSGLIIIDKANSSNVVTASSTGNTILVGTTAANNGLNIVKGVLSFDDKNGLIATGTGTPTFIVGVNGQVVAPATDTLNIRGSWNFSHRGAINPRGGTIALGSGTNNYTQNGNAVVLNNLLVDKTGTQSWLSTDTLIVQGDFNMVGGAVLNNPHLVFQGDFTKTTGSVVFGSIIAAGGNDQTITLSAQDDMRAEGLIVNKTSGKVFLGSSPFRLNSLRLSSGILNSNGKSMTVFGANSIFGGNSNSFIEGTVRIESTTAWAGSRYFIPVGRGSNYRPVQLHNSGATNTWTVTYVDSDTVSDLGTTGNHGIDAFSTSEHWIINRISGGGASNPALVELSTLGKDPSWNDTDIIVARWNPFTSEWVNHSPGSTGASSNMIMTTLGWTLNDARIFTIGVDNVPAPVAVRNEGISGNELDLVKNTANDNSQAAAQAAISFNVFPNPVAETLNIALSGADKGSITLSDLSGKVLGVYSADTRSINMSNFAAGVYFATFSNGSQRITQRVIRN